MREKLTFCLFFFFFLPLQNQERKHRTYVYVLIVTEVLEDWEDSVNIGKLPVIHEKGCLNILSFFFFYYAIKKIVASLFSSSVFFDNE